MTAISGNYGNFPPANIDPNKYAQQYAAENNLSLEDAKAELRKIHNGDPVKPDNSVFNSGTNNGNSFGVSGISDILVDNEEGMGISELLTSIIQLLEKLVNIFQNGSEPEDEMDPDAYAQQYADEHNMTLEEAKEELRTKKGEPEKKGEKKGNDIPADNPFVKTGDPDADAQKYADEHNITLEEAKAYLKEHEGDPVQPN